MTRAITRHALAIACIHAALVAVPAMAQSPHTHQHSFGDAAKWAKVFDDPRRDAWQKPHQVIGALALKPDAVVADIGAGTGFLARRMASVVGRAGKVLAVDVQPEMVRMLDTLARQSGLAQIVPSLGAEDDVRLPAGSVDLAIMVDVYHELAYPFEVLASIVRSLKPGGRVVFVEYRAEDERVPIKPIHKMSQAQIRREALVLPLVWERTIDSLPWQHLVVFRKAS